MPGMSGCVKKRDGSGFGACAHATAAEQSLPRLPDSQVAWPSGYHRVRRFVLALGLSLRALVVWELAAGLGVLGSWLLVGSRRLASPPPLGVLVGLPKPVRKRRLHLVAVDDAHHVRDLRLRALIGAPHLRVLQPARQEDADLEEALLRPDEEVAGLAREHDRVVRRVDPLIAEIGGGLAQPLPCLPQIVRQIPGQRRFGRRPAVVRFAVLDPGCLQW